VLLKYIGSNTVSYIDFGQVEPGGEYDVPAERAESFLASGNFLLMKTVEGSLEVTEDREDESSLLDVPAPPISEEEFVTLSSKPARAKKSDGTAEESA